MSELFKSAPSQDMNNLERANKANAAYLKTMEAIAIDEVKRIMRIHKNLVSFSDEMGLARFYDKKGQPVFLLEQYTNSNFESRYRPTYKTFENLLDIYGLIDGEGMGIIVNRD